MKGGWSYRCAGNGVWGGTNQRRCLGVVSLRSLVCLREAGGAGSDQILAHKPNRGGWPVPLTRGDLYAGRVQR